MNEHIDLGAYVLGGLAPEERVAFEAHLSGCRECQLESQQFAPVAGRLGALDAAAARTLLAPQRTEPEGLTPVVLLDALRTQRRARRIVRRSAMVAAVAASLAAGFFLAPVVHPDPGPQPDASYQVHSSTGQQVSIGLLSKAWGTELEFDGSGLPTHGTLSLWVLDSTGTADRAGAWNATKTGKTVLTGAVPTQLGEISVIQLRDVDSTVLAELHLPLQAPSQPS